MTMHAHIYIILNACTHFLLPAACMRASNDCFHLSRPKLERTACTTNQECALEGDAAAMCSSVGDFSLSNSYGSIPCNLCTSSQPICLVSDSSSSSSGARGTCACMLQRTPFQSCSRKDLSMRVVPDASQLCAVSLHAGASSRSVSALYDWNYLAAAPCVLISMSNAYCYEVGGYGLMVVGHGVVKTSSSILSVGSGNRRRLLSDSSSQWDNGGNGTSLHQQIKLQLDSFLSGWSHVKEPCRTLASEFQRVYLVMSNSSQGLAPWMDVQWRQHGGLSRMEVMQLEGCIHWRVVGRNMVQALNLSSSSNDCCSHMFMSVGDLMSVVASNKGVGLQMLQMFPDVLSAWAQGTSLYEDASVLADVIRQHAVVTYLDSLWKEHFNRTTDGNASSSSWRNANATEVAIIKRFIAQHRMQIALFDAYATGAARVFPSDLSTLLPARLETLQQQQQPTADQKVGDKPLPPGRRLLQQQSVVNAYSSLVASTTGFSNIAVSA